jgi:hypothetical protein
VVLRFQLRSVTISHHATPAVAHEEIAVAGWPERTGGEVGDQEIEPSKPRYIINVRGYGYKLQLA